MDHLGSEEKALHQRVNLSLQARPNLRMFSQGRLLLLLLSAFLLTPFFARASEENWSTILAEAQSNPREVIAEAERALHQSTATGDKKAELQAVWRLGLTHRLLADSATMKKYVERGIALAREQDNKEVLCWFFHSDILGKVFDNRLSDANAVYNEAVSYAEKNRLTACLPWIYLSQTTVLAAFSKYSDAVALLTKSYALFEAQGNRYGMARALLGFATATRGTDERDIAKAIDYLERAQALVDLRVYRTLAAEIYARLGQKYLDRKDMTQARRYLETSVALSHELQYFILEGIGQLNLARLAMNERHLDAALAYLDKAQPLVSQHRDSVHLLTCLLLRAEVLAQLGRRMQSIEALAQAKAVLLRTNDPFQGTSYYRRAAAIHVRFGDYQEAYRQMEALREADQRMVKATSVALEHELNTRLGVKLKENENALLRAEQQEAKSRAIALTLALVLSFVILGGLVLYLRKRAAAARVEAEHLQKLAAAEATANQAKSRFLANMSHELRTPLNAILGFAQLVSREPALSSSTRNDLGIIVKSGEHLYGLINQVLDLSKIEAGHTALNETNFDLYSLLDELEGMFRLTAKQKGLALIVDYGSTPPRYVRADAGKLRQVLINLMNNAIKFTRQGGVTLRIGTGDGAKSNRLSFAVSDTGPGIAAAELQDLGKAFVQTQAGLQAKEGTGLGLAISRRFVNMMGGDLTISSQLGQGAIFSFEIDVAVVNEASPDAGRSTPARRVTGVAAGQPRYRILVVDDQKEGRHLLARLLAPLGFEVREAENGEEAVATWAAWAPHLICMGMSMRMPAMDGREATRRIKAMAGQRKTTIIALSARSFDEDRSEFLQVGCDDFIRKPFQEHALFDLLHKHLGVTFIYDDETPRHVDSEPDTERLALLPADLQGQMVGALAGLNVNAISSAIDAIRAHDDGLADALAALANDFEYGRMLALFSKRNTATMEGLGK